MFNKTAATEEAEEHANGNDENLGDFLKNARISQGLNLATIADETRINYKSLVALEENSRAALPADVFSRGFVKIYATYLKLDPQKAIRLYEDQWGAAAQLADPFAAPKQRSGLAPGIVATLLFVVLFFAIRIYYPGHHDGPPSPATTQSPVSGNVTPGPAATPAAAPTDNPPPAGAAGGETATEPVHPPMDEAQTAPEEENKQQQTAGPAILPPYEIKLQAAEGTKIKLSLDGQKAVEKTFPAGSSQTWQAAKEFDLTLERAKGVTLTVNGAAVELKTEGGQPVTIHHP